MDTEGVLLLLHAREGLALVSVGVGINEEFVGGGLLAALSSLATKTPERGLELQVFCLMAVTEEDGLALAQLLVGCRLPLPVRAGGAGGLAGAFHRCW